MQIFCFRVLKIYLQFLFGQKYCGFGISKTIIQTENIKETENRNVHWGRKGSMRWPEKLKKNLGYMNGEEKRQNNNEATKKRDVEEDKKTTTKDRSSLMTVNQKI